MECLKEVIRSIVMGLAITICIFIIKNQFSSILLVNANYGMPMLIEKRYIDNLFLGSSTFRQGLDISQIENALGEDSYILSYDGNQPIMEYYELQNLYAHGVEIERLFVDFYPFTAASGFKISDAKIFLETDMRFKREVAVMLHKENYSWRDVQEMYFGANSELLLTWPIAYPLVNHRFYKGGSTVETIAMERTELDNLAVPETGDLNIVQMEYLLKIVDLTKENGTELAFVETPKYGSLFLSEQYNILTDEMEKKLEGVTIYRVKEPEEKIGNDECIYFQLDRAEYFSDLVHLSSQGREEFTRKFLEKL